MTIERAGNLGSLNAIDVLVGRQVRETRLAKGLTAVHAAQRLDMTADLYEASEAGERRFSAIDLLNLTAAFDVTVDRLLSGVHGVSPHRADQQRRPSSLPDERIDGGSAASIVEKVSPGRMIEEEIARLPDREPAVVTLKKPRKTLEWIDWLLGGHRWPKGTEHLIKADAEDLLNRMSVGEAYALTRHLDDESAPVTLDASRPAGHWGYVRRAIADHAGIERGRP